MSWFTQMGALVLRNYYNTIRNPHLLQARVLQTIILSLFVGGIYFDAGEGNYTDTNDFRTITGFLFFQSVNFLFLSLG